MPLFERFPLIDYDHRIVKDISKRISLFDNVRRNVSMFENYIVVDGEKIEDISQKFYGTPHYHWVIMLMNEIIDPFHDWPLSVKEMSEFVENKYGIGKSDDHHHWERDGKVVNEQDNIDFYDPRISPSPSVPVGAVSINNRQYEDRVNEEKRKIKILDVGHIPQIEAELTDLLNK